MSISGIQGSPLEVTVVASCNLDDKDWISRQDPYVSIEYGGTKFQTQTCTGEVRFLSYRRLEGDKCGGVEQSHLSADELIGSGRIQLHKVLARDFDDASLPGQSRSGRHSGEVRLTLHYPNVNQYNKAKLAPTAPPHATAPNALSQVLPYSSLPHAPSANYPPTTPYSAPSPHTGYPPHPATYPPAPAIHSAPASYPPQAYHPLQPCPPTHNASTYNPTGPSGVYPPPPY